jgi:hypothetical protein
MLKIRLIPTLIAILIVELILVACMFIPYSSKAIPSWNVMVTDENGRPVAGALVKQSAAFSGLEEKWMETQRTAQERSSLASREDHPCLSKWANV